VSGVLLRPLPMKDVERLAGVFTTDERNRGSFFNFMPISRLNFEDYRKTNQVFTDMACYSGIPLAYTGKGEPEQIVGEIVSGNFFRLLGVEPVLGRGFLPEELLEGPPVDERGEPRTLGRLPLALLLEGRFPWPRHAFQRALFGQASSGGLQAYARNPRGSGSESASKKRSD